jgi:hypothetical protein
MDIIPVDYRIVHLLAVGIAVGSGYLLWWMAVRMLKIRHTAMATARCVDVILIHTCISTAWIVLSSARGIHLTEGVCRWPLDLLQYGGLQGTWICVWALRLVYLDPATRRQFNSCIMITAVLLIIFGIPVTVAGYAALNGYCGAFVGADAVITLTALVHLGLMHAILMRYRKLPAPLCISPEAEWCCIFVFVLMVTTAFCIGTNLEYIARHVFTPCTVAMVAVVWQYIQCKPAFVVRDDAYDHVMQDSGASAPQVNLDKEVTVGLLQPESKHTQHTNNEQVASFLRFCDTDFPATVHMICALTKQLQTRSVTNPPSKSSIGIDNRLRFTEMFINRGGSNSECVLHEMTIPPGVSLDDSVELRQFAYDFLLAECGVAYATECKTRASLVRSMTMTALRHPALLP